MSSIFFAPTFCLGQFLLFSNIGLKVSFSPPSKFKSNTTIAVRTFKNYFYYKGLEKTKVSALHLKPLQSETSAIEIIYVTSHNT